MRKNLKELAIDYNPIVAPPRDVWTKGTVATIEFAQHVLAARTKQEFIYYDKDIGSYPIDIELLVDRAPTEDGSQGPYGCRKVDLSKNRIRRVPENIGANLQLEILLLSHNLISQLDEAVGMCTNLTELDLSHNELPGLPNRVNSLTRLTSLKIQANKNIPKFPDDFFINVVLLKHLDAEDNRIDELPMEVRNLTHLTHLNLGKNRISLIPSEIGDLERLNFLSLHHNRIQAIPSAIGRLLELVSLDVSDNQLALIAQKYKY